MSTSPLSSTAQQDQVARQNGSQMRRQSADHNAGQRALDFASLLQASDAPEAENPVTPATDPQDAQASEPATTGPSTPAEWLLMAQALGVTATGPAATTASSDDGSTPTPTTTGIARLADGATTTAPDGGTAPETAEAAQEGPATASAPPARRAPGAVVAQWAQTLAGHGAEPATTPGGAAQAAADASTTLPSAWHMDVPGQPGSRLRETGGTGDAAADPAEGDALLPPGLERLAARSGADSPGAQADTGAGAGAEVSTPTDTTVGTGEGATGPAEWAGHWSEAMEDLGHQVSYWLGKGVRQAQIQVQAGLERPLEVAVSLENGQAALRFLTDNPLARTAIENGAADVLRDGLARDGIALADVSVGSHERRGQDTSGQPDRPRPLAWGPRVADALPAPAGPDTPRRSQRALDLYA